MVQVTRPKLQVRGLLLQVALCSLLVGCQTTSKGSFCQIAKAHRPSQAAIDALTDDQVRDLLAHNRKGAALCGWKP
jgi:hypothetical protein